MAKKIANISIKIMTLAAVYIFVIMPHTAWQVKAEKTMPTKATGWDVYIDENNAVCILTNDKKRTSSIYYRTEGFSISRGKFKPSMKQLANGAATDHYFKPIYASAQSTWDSGNRQINIFRYDFGEIKGSMTGPWQAEIDEVLEFGGTAYIRFDCVMYVYHGAAIHSGPYYGHPPINPDETEIRNPHQIQHAEPWSAGANTGLRTHYHRWLPITKGIEPEEPPEDFWKDHHVSLDISLPPDYQGGNANVEGYDAGYGIPSTKTVTGYAKARPWYGQIDVWARMSSKQFNIRHLYKWWPLPRKTEDGEESYKNAVEELNTHEFKDKQEIMQLLDGSHPVGDVVHDTELEKVYHHYIKVWWKDDAGNEIGTPSDDIRGGQAPSIQGVIDTPDPPEGNGRSVPDSSDTEYDPEDGFQIQWKNGWEATAEIWHAPEYRNATEDEPEYPGQVKVRDGYWGRWSDGDHRESIYTPLKPVTKPSGIYRGYRWQWTWTDAKVLKTEYQLTAIVNREYWDEKYGGEDGYIQTYVAFEYLEPYISKFFDLATVTLLNDVYGKEEGADKGTMTFPATIDTYMDAGKAKLLNKGIDAILEDYYEMYKDKGGEKLFLNPEDIKSEDYIYWSEQKSKPFKGGDTHPEEMQTYAICVKELEQKIFDETKSINDYCQVRNPVDNMPATCQNEKGILLGNKDKPWTLADRNAKKGIISGCDFRHGTRWMGLPDLGVHPELRGMSNVNKEYDLPTGGKEDDKSKFYFECKNSAGGKADAYAYTSDGQSKCAAANEPFEKLGYQTTEIDNKTANGAHPTQIKARYINKIVGMTIPDGLYGPDDVLAGHLYGGGGGDHGYSTWGGCMASSESYEWAEFNEESGYGPVQEGEPIIPEPNVNTGSEGNYQEDVSFIVDPVQIHTPIMAPGVIENENKKEIDKINGPDHVREKIQLWRDESADTTSQLRLDQYYYIKWKDLSQLYNARDHRDAPTPGVEEGSAGGYWTETDYDPENKESPLEEDEFTLNKYMKFPFEVYYEGKFYKDNQWIKINKPGKSTESTSLKFKKDYKNDPYEDKEEVKDTINETDYLRDSKAQKTGGSLQSDNHWLYTPFYIPSWAKEGLYEDIKFEDSEDTEGGKTLHDQNYQKWKDSMQTTDETTRDGDDDDTSVEPWDVKWVEVTDKDGKTKKVKKNVDLDKCAQLMVEAINKKGGADQVQELANTYYNVTAGTYNDGAAYIAIFNIPVQLSGWIYDFTITGTSDKDIYGYQTPDELATSKITQDYDYSFAKFWQEKKSGRTNRLGSTAVRYMNDGNIAHIKDMLNIPLDTANPKHDRVYSDVEWKEKNTVALVGAWKENGGKLHEGKSNYWKYMGAVPKGNIFSFALKTMSNMWNFNNKDKIVITPTFSYHKYDTTAKKWIEKGNQNLKVYYSDNGKEYIPYGSEKDRSNIQKVSMGSPQFEQSYYEEEDSFNIIKEEVNPKTGKKEKISVPIVYGDWLNYGVYAYNKRKKIIGEEMTLESFKNIVKNNVTSLPSNALTPQMWLTQKIDAYTLSNITIPERLRLLTGEADQLKFNIINGGEDPKESEVYTDVDGIQKYRYKYDENGIKYNKNFVTYRDLAKSENYKKEFISDANVGFGDGKERDDTPELTYKYNGGEVTLKLDNLDEKLRASIQSWYCQYYVPSDLFVVDLEEHPEFRDFDDPLSPFYGKASLDGSIPGNVLDPTWSKNKEPYWDYMEFYAAKEYKEHDGLTEDEEIFIPDGFLTVNFSILAIKDGINHLVYKGSYCDEWAVENYTKIPYDPGNPSNPVTIAPPEEGITEDGVPTQTGDVIVVDLSKKFSDRFRSGIYNIN